MEMITILSRHTDEKGASQWLKEDKERDSPSETPNSGENGHNSEKGQNRVLAKSSQGNKAEKTTMQVARNQWKYQRHHGDTPAPHGYGSQE